MEHDDGALEAFNRAARLIRDDSRPEIGVAAAAIGDALRLACRGMEGSLEPGESGPERWSWLITGNRTLTLAPSPREECLGHPLLTIREEVYAPFDNQLVTSCLILGKEREKIVTGVLTLLLGHTAAAAGMLAAASADIAGPNVLDVIEQIRGIGQDSETAADILEAAQAIIRRDPGSN